MSLKAELADLLDKLSDLLEFREENPFKIKAFRNGADILRSFEGDIEPVIKSGEIKELKGIGKGILSIIYEYYKNGTSSELTNLEKEIPHGIMELRNISGLGIKKIKALNRQIGISSLSALEQACNGNKIAELSGFGKKSQDHILKEIARIRSVRDLFLVDSAEKVSERLYSILKKTASVTDVQVSGELRRRMEIISRLEYVVLTTDYEQFLGELNKTKLLLDENYQEPAILKDNVISGRIYQIDTDTEIKAIVYVTDNPPEFDKILFLTTGSEEFMANLSGGNWLKVSGTETEIFTKKGLPFIIPEMREKLYFSAKPAFRVNSNLTLESFQGLLHFHTVSSDGKNSLKEMANAAESAGFHYIAVCDHSKSAFYARGLTEEQVMMQKEEIKSIEAGSLKIFQGIESDILQDGSLDYSTSFLKNFDFIVASVHSRFNMTEEEMTSRIIRAIENEFTDLLGHPTGRLLLSREGYKLNIKKIIDACAANSVAIEINASPYRLDLDWRNIYYAREQGCNFAINPDAHSIEGIREIKYGIGVARKGGLMQNEVINCLNLEDFVKYLNRKTIRRT
ncbi:MAG: PHP domain-containing protein [Methanococcaceae archaeon]